MKFGFAQPVPNAENKYWENSMNTPTEKNSPLPGADQITLAWLRQHVPLVWWKGFFGLLVVVFSAGFAVASWEPMASWIQTRLASEKTDQISTTPSEAHAQTKEPQVSSDEVVSISVRKYLKEIRDIINCRIDLPLGEHPSSSRIQLTETEMKKILSEAEKRHLSEEEIQQALDALIQHKQSVAKILAQRLIVIKELLGEIDNAVRKIDMVNSSGMTSQTSMFANETSALGAYRCLVSLEDG